MSFGNETNNQTVGEGLAPLIEGQRKTFLSLLATVGIAHLAMTQYAISPTNLHRLVGGGEWRKKSPGSNSGRF
jgi:hypothetical protein